MVVKTAPILLFCKAYVLFSVLCTGNGIPLSQAPSANDENLSLRPNHFRRKLLFFSYMHTHT